MAQKFIGSVVIKWIFAISFFGSLTAFSQQDKIDPSGNFNYDLLNSLVMDEVNSIRNRKRLDSLVHDPSLDAASLDHAKYMGENNVFGHAQKIKQKRTPYDRVVFFGGNHNKVGENIQVLPIAAMMEESNNKLTYQKLAKTIVDSWKGSKEHYENIINPNYTVVSYGFYMSDGKLYSCQVLASQPFIEKYKSSKGDALFVKNKDECFNCKRTKNKINKDEAFLGWYTVSNDSIYYWNMDSYESGGKMAKRNLSKIFRGKGTIAIDVIHNEQFDCKGNSSYHNALYYDGYYLGYVNKQSLKVDLHPSENYLQVFVGMKPEFVDTFYQVDFNYIKKWKPCMHSMTIYVTPDYLKPVEYFTIPNPEVSMKRTIIIEDSVEVKINYARGQTSEDTSIFIPLIKSLDSLVAQNHKIQEINFTGVASIEGDEKTNEKLFMKRGTLVSNYLKRYYPDLQMGSQFYENFDDFRSGLIAMGYTDVIKLSDDSLRIWANKRSNEKVISDLLDETRYSSILIIYRDYIEIKEGAYGMSVQRLADLTKEKNLRELIPLYEVIANLAINGDASIIDSLLTLSFPETSEFATLHWYKFIAELNLTDEPVTEEKLNYLKDIGAIPTTADFLEYRLMFNIFNRNELIDVTDFGEVSVEVKQRRQKSWIECLELISGVESGRYSDKMVAPILLNNVLKMKFTLKQTYFVCQYLIEWGYTTEPYILLSKFAKMPGQMPKLYKQYVKLGYYLGKFQDKKEWRKIFLVLKNLAENHPTDFCDLFKWDQMGVRSLEIKELAELFCEKCRE